jgi:hypothetical protein
MAVPEGEHTLGGIAGEGVAETTDPDPARVALVADAVSAYLFDALGVHTDAWSTFRVAAETERRATLQHKD